jgi:AcrR family transcriptional regulator
MARESGNRGAPAGGDNAGDTAQDPESPRRKRLPRSERERMIVAEAIRFFAEVGFEGQTRELARRLGITQPLIFRYFPTKEDLIERVYQEVYLARWDPAWEDLLEDRSLPLLDRLTAFYKAYAKVIFTYEWVRIFVYSGLKGVNINKRFLALIRDRVLKRVMRELRASHGLPTPEDVPFGEAELELAWGLHGSIFYIAIRKWIYEVDIPSDIEAVIAAEVESFVIGAPKVVGRLLRQHNIPASARQASAGG